MKKGVKWLVGIVVGLVLVVVLLLGGGFLLINTTSFQNKLLQKATTMLAEKLQTKVAIDSISIDVKRDGKTVRMFTVTGGIIVGREFSPLDSLDGEVLLESLKIAHTGITEVPLPFGI